MNERVPLLERAGRVYGAHRLAVTFTASTSGDAAKRVLAHGWENTTPIPDGDFGAALVGFRGRDRNPCIVLRPSGLIGIECDTAADLAELERLELPPTATVQSSQPCRRHYYFRPDPTVGVLPFVAFRFEDGKVTADRTRYFVCPPAVHPSGAVYKFLPGLSISEIGFATLPAATYGDLVQRSRRSDDATRAQLQHDPAAKVTPGRRRDLTFRFACAMRRWTADRDEILEAANRWNTLHCDPPLDVDQVAAQVEGAMRKPGLQALNGGRA